MRVWLELNQEEGERLFDSVKNFTVDRMKTAVVNAPKDAVNEPEQEEKPVTLEQVRAVLAAKSQAGKKAEVGELLKKHGATKLTDVDPTRYADLLKDAESL